MKNHTSRLTFVLAMAALSAGCSSAAKSSSATAESPASPPASRATGSANYVKSPLSTQTTTASISDPSLNGIVAATLTIPAGWKLEGIEMRSPCTFVPWPVFRAYSQDGLMQYRTEPVFGWRWRPNLRGMDNTGCANINGPISAADFLRHYYLGTIAGGVHVVGTMPVPAPYAQWAQGLAAQGNQMNARVAPALQANHTADTAALHVEVVNGSFVVEERLRAVVECSEARTTGPMSGGSCWARVDVLTAPEGQLDALVKVVDANNLPHGVNTQQWMQAAMARQQKEGQDMINALTQQEKQESQMLYQQFQQIMARSQQEHQQFMQQQESQFQSSMNNAWNSMNARTTASSDWVDYALDRQTVVGPGGEPMKVSNTSEVWTNGTDWYVTNETNANPSGILRGNWQQATKLHGNGQPIQ
jgi:predicted HNH restriction endonuclease